MSKIYVVKLADGTLHSIEKTHGSKPRDPRYIEIVDGLRDPLTGKLEEGVWLQIEDIERPDEPGVFDRVATVNETLKDSILAQRETDRLNNEMARDNKDAEFKGLKRALKRIKKSDLSTAEGIKTAILTIQKVLVKLEERIINIDPDS